MSDLMGFEELVARLTQISRLSQRETSHLIGEVLAYLDDSLEEFVRRRHGELQREGLRNEQIYERLALETAQRRFRVDALSARQLRRLVYG
jgi:hypothetical protein